ncbi:MAG: hypothetical protein FJ272_13450, partial [Planctomycetes bacterium]|nr:hypothetical protein [Planctomycetota bacterium]
MPRKLVIAIVNKHDARHLRDALVGGGFRFTEVASSGGFLREGNVTLLIGVPAEQVDNCIALIQQHCHARDQAVNLQPPDIRMVGDMVGQVMTVKVGGAQVFVLNV